MATLHKNGMEEKKLSKYVTHRISEDHDVVTLSVSFPEEGQYGMDIYTRELSRHGQHDVMFFAAESQHDLLMIRQNHYPQISQQKKRITKV